MRSVMNRKIGAAAISAAALAMVFSGCGKSEHGLNPDHPVTITVWHYYNGVQQQAFDRMITEFNETVGSEKGIVVQAFSQGSVNELLTKVTDAANEKLGSEDMPDIFGAYADTAYELNQLGRVADIGQYLTKEEQDEYVDAYMREGAFDGEDSRKMFPIAKSTEILMLNKTDWDAFSAGTGASEDKLQTWEGIAELAEMYYKWTDAQTPEPEDGKAFFGRDEMANYILIGSKQMGHEVFQVKDGQVTYNLDKETMRRLWDCYYIPYINGYFAAEGRFRSDDMKTSDIIAMACSSTGATYFPLEVTRNDGTTYPIEGAVYALPNFAGTEPCAVQQGAGMVVAKSTEEREYASVVFLKWFTDVEQNAQFATNSGYLPVKKAANQIPVLDEALDASGQNSSSLMKDSLHIGVEMTNRYELYTNQAFRQGTQARNVIKASMQDWAARDAQAVQDAVAGGASREAAAEKFDTDENFEAWLAELQGLLNDLK